LPFRGELRTARVGGDRDEYLHLGVSPLELNDWLAGRRTPSSSVYTRALDIVTRGPFARKKLS
jgi:DNA-binding transcriptional regulator YdaS (Cro superfamily)